MNAARLHLETLRPGGWHSIVIHRVYIGTHPTAMEDITSTVTVHGSLGRRTAPGNHRTVCAKFSRRHLGCRCLQPHVTDNDRCPDAVLGELAPTAHLKDPSAKHDSTGCTQGPGKGARRLCGTGGGDRQAHYVSCELARRRMVDRLRLSDLPSEESAHAVFLVALGAQSSGALNTTLTHVPKRCGARTRLLGPCRSACSAAMCELRLVWVVTVLFAATAHS